ncbi:NAC domain-containing protein 86-like [Lolium rigidum]|uniref:NAC domain-containing protein 86-like n=1 Tax=Lolium rigidum TaxID=89674 RepID=UPI001F5D0CE8|nr:NAC domain-containing protein 86-like [Lolium rigidum]
MEEADGLDDFYKLHQFKPSKEHAVTYFLPRLLAGSPLPHGADMLIRHADVYACEPKDLAAEYAPVPSAVRTGDRFFFTTCKHKSGRDVRVARVAGAGTWAVQKTENVYDDEGAKVGEVKHLSFKKGKVSTGWVMEEYRCLRPEALVADGEKVLCKIHLAPKASAAARQESDAYKLRQEPAQPPVPQPDTVTASAHAQKRRAPVATADLDLSSSKKMRVATPVQTPDEKEYEECPVVVHACYIRFLANCVHLRCSS